MTLPEMYYYDPRKSEKEERIAKYRGHAEEFWRFFTVSVD